MLCFSSPFLVSPPLSDLEASLYCFQVDFILGSGSLRNNVFSVTDPKFRGEISVFGGSHKFVYGAVCLFVEGA